jgi:hypothetical protein
MLRLNNDSRWVLAIVGTLLAILIINPVGFVGGGADDWQYLNASRCWVRDGPCLPTDHWQGRWPIIAPLAATIALFGETRLSVGIPNLAFSLGCLALVAWLGNRRLGPPVGYLAALFLAVVPVFAVELLDASAGAPELFFLLAAACCAVLYSERPSPWLAFGTGLCLSLAFQVRETAIAAAPLALVAAWLVARDDRKCWLLAIGGATLPLAIEALTFWLATGDPLWRRNLSVGHAQISSTELVGPIDESRSPILNPAYIANWRREAGIHIHWLIDGLANLVANAKAGLTISAAALFFAMYGRQLNARDRALVLWCLGAAIYWACFLIYVLAIDPKARMMLVPVTLAALALAVVLRDRIAKHSLLIPYAAAFIVWSAGLIVTLAQPQVGRSEAAVVKWTKRFRDQIETNETSRRHLALSGATGLADLGSGRPYLLLRLPTRCAIWANENMHGSLVAIDRSPMSIFDPAGKRQVNNFCLFRYSRPINPRNILRALAVR